MVAPKMFCIEIVVLLHTLCKYGNEHDLGQKGCDTIKEIPWLALSEAPSDITYNRLLDTIPPFPESMPFYCYNQRAFEKKRLGASLSYTHHLPLSCFMLSAFLIFPSFSHLSTTTTWCTWTLFDMAGDRYTISRDRMADLRVSIMILIE